MDILTIEHLTKNFGTQQVIKDVSLSVPEHSILGFIGQNGAGKTTTMKMVLGLLRPTDGKISICGETVTYGQTKTNRFVGYLPDVPEFYGYMKPYEYLKLCGEITGMTVKDTKQKSDELLSLVGLDKVNKKIGGFSRGMKQRLGIAQALLNNPKLLICDEPTSALDPIGRKEILDILNQVKGKTTVVFSTHILSDVERICDNIALLHDGRIALSGSLSQVKAQYKQDGLEIEFHSREDLESFQSAPEMEPFLEYTQHMNSYNTEHVLTLHTNDIGKLEAAVIATLVQRHLLPERLEVLEPTLEKLFMEVVK